MTRGYSCSKDGLRRCMTVMELLLRWMHQASNPASGGANVGSGRREGRTVRSLCTGSVNTDDVLDAFDSSAEGVESRRKAAEWAAEGWQ